MPGKLAGLEVPESIGEGEFIKRSGTSLVGGVPSAGAAAWGSITGTLAAQTDLDSALGAKAPVSHSHAESDVTGLTTDLSGKASSSHGHPESDINGLVTDLSGKAASSHGHGEADVSGLVTDLAGKAASSHAHAPGDVTGTAVVTSDARLSDARTPTAHNHAGTDINSGTLDGDRLPAISTTKRSGVPAAPSPSGLFLKDDGGWAAPGGSGGLGYAINVQALTSSPADGATVYFGTLPKAPVSAAGTSKVYIRKAGTIKIAEIYCYSGTAGSNESWSLYIRKNNSADTLIATLSLSASERVFSNAALSIAVAAGDYIEIKGVQPTWGTNPLTTIYGGYIYIE